MQVASEVLNVSSSDINREVFAKRNSEFLARFEQPTVPRTYFQDRLVGPESVVGGNGGNECVPKKIPAPREIRRWLGRSPALPGSLPGFVVQPVFEVVQPAL